MFSVGVCMRFAWQVIFVVYCNGVHLSVEDVVLFAVMKCYYDNKIIVLMRLGMFYLYEHCGNL